MEHRAKLHFNNFDLNITDDEGKTPLFYANRNHRKDALCELIRCGAEFKLMKLMGKLFCSMLLRTIGGK